jgi:hypothetical protein
VSSHFLLAKVIIAFRWSTGRTTLELLYLHPAASHTSAVFFSSLRKRSVEVGVHTGGRHTSSTKKSTMPSCRMLPHGSYSLIPAILSSMAWLASLFQDGCDFSKLTGPTVQQLAINPKVPWLEVGLAAYREPYLNTQSGNWEVVYSGACFAYPDDGSVNRDTVWNAARAFDFVALVLGGGGCFFLWFATCCVFSRVTWRWAGYEVLLAAVAQCLSFLWFNTSLCHTEGNTCELFWGSKADIVSAVFWTVAAVSVFCHYPVPRDVRGDGVFRNGANRANPRGPTGPPSASQHDLSVGDEHDDAMFATEAGFASSSTRLPPPAAAFDDASTSTPPPSAVSDSPPRTMASGEDPREDSHPPLRGSSSRELKDIELT